jgi:hypothetical protein
MQQSLDFPFTVSSRGEAKADVVSVLRFATKVLSLSFWGHQAMTTPKRLGRNEN